MATKIFAAVAVATLSTAAAATLVWASTIGTLPLFISLCLLVAGLGTAATGCHILTTLFRNAQ